jgi:putative MATE family efflux protein
MSSSKISDYLLQGSVAKGIMKFAVPLLIGNLLQQFYNITDSIIVGQFLGKQSFAAVSASYFIYYFVISFVIGIGSGATVVVSQFFGAKQYEKVQRSFSTFFIFMLIGGVILSIAGIIFARPLFLLTKTPADVIPEAVAYFRIYIGGTFVFVTFNSILSILRGVGESMRPMNLILTTTIINIVLDLLFIVVFHWGVQGAALATVIAQIVGMVAGLVYIAHRHPLLSIQKKDMTFDKALFKHELRIGLPTSVQQCAISLGLMALLGIVNTFGTDTLTAYGAAGKISTLVMQVMLTLSGALAAFTGQNIGAGQFDRVRRGVSVSMLLNLVFCAVVYGSIWFFGPLIMRAFTNDANVIAIGNNYLIIVGAFFVIHGALIVFNGVMRGSGDTMFTMINSLLCLWLIRIPLASWLSKLYGQDGIWLAIGLSITIGFIIAFIYYLSGHWKNRGVIRKEKM